LSKAPKQNRAEGKAKKNKYRGPHTAKTGNSTNRPFFETALNGAMERDKPLALDCIPSQADYVVLSPENAIVSEHQTSREAVRALAQYVLKTGEQGSIYKKASKGWEIF
jgi:hypothetical protein